MTNTCKTTIAPYHFVLSADDLFGGYGSSMMLTRDQRSPVTPVRPTHRLRPIMRPPLTPVPVHSATTRTFTPSHFIKCDTQPNDVDPRSIRTTVKPPLRSVKPGSTSLKQKKKYFFRDRKIKERAPFNHLTCCVAMRCSIMLAPAKISGGESAAGNGPRVNALLLRTHVPNG